MKLALMVLHERRQGAQSRVAGYVAQLPRAFETPLHWTAEESAQLQYPHLEAEVRGADDVQGAAWSPGMLHPGAKPWVQNEPLARHPKLRH